MSTRASAPIHKVSMHVNGGLAVNVSGMSEDEGTIGGREFDISRDHDVMSENGRDQENDDEDEDADEVDDEVDGEQSESSESSEDTITFTRKRKYQGSHDNYSKKDLLKILKNHTKDTVTRLTKEGIQQKKELMQSRNDYKKVSITLKKEVAQHIKTKEHIRKLKSELQMEKDRVENKKEMVKMNGAKFKANAEAAKSRHVMELQVQKHIVEKKASMILN